MRSQKMVTRNQRVSRPWNRAWLRFEALERRENPTPVLPGFTGLRLPASNPALPAAFAPFTPPITATDPTSGSPVISDFTRTAGKDQTVLLVGDALSAFGGSAAGRDSEYLVYGRRAGSGQPTLTAGDLLRLDGPRAVVTLPDDLLDGDTYLLWPGSSRGWGRPAAINKTEAHWALPNVVTVGKSEPVAIHGRNLTLGGGVGLERVFIQPIDTSPLPPPTPDWLELTDENPYRVTFNIPASFPAGKYELWAHSGHGAQFGWADPVSLTIRAPFPTSSTKHNVKTLGATGDGVSDDYEYIKQAILDANDEPGSTVYFPAGTYAVSKTLSFNNITDIRFEGATKDAQGNPVARPVIQPIVNMNRLFEGNAACKNLLFTDLEFRSNGKMVVDNKVDPVLIHIRDAEDLSFKSVRFTAVDQGIGAVPLDLEQGERITITDSRFATTGNVDLIATRQVRVHNCEFFGALNVGQLLFFVQSTDVSVTGCTAKDYHHLESKYEKTIHGYAGGRFLVGQGAWNENFYVQNNETFDFAPNFATALPQQLNSGEQILFEQLGPVWHGRPVGPGGANHVTLAGLTRNYVTDLENLIATVIDGKGLGQRRRVLSIDIDTKGGKVNLESPWGVAPDATSSIALGGPLQNIVIYQNTLQGKDEYLKGLLATEKVALTGVQVHGVAHVEIVENDISLVRDGVSLWPLQNIAPVVDDGRPQFGTNWFDRVAGNTIRSVWRGVNLTTQNPGQIIDKVSWVYNTVGHGSAILGSTVRSNKFENFLLPGTVNITNAVVALNSEFDYRAIDLAVIEDNEYKSGTSAKTKALTGVLFDGTPSATNIHNVVIRNNEVEFGESGYGVEFRYGADFGSAALFENTWTGAFKSTFGIAPVGIPEPPTRVIRFAWDGVSPVLPTDVPLRNAGTATVKFEAAPATDWFKATVSGTIASGGEGLLQLTPDKAKLNLLGNGTYTAAVKVTDGKSQPQEEWLTVEITINRLTETAVGPYNGVLPDLRKDRVTVIEAEHFDRGANDTAYFDATAGNSGTGGLRPEADVDIDKIGTAPDRYAVIATEQEEWLKYTVNVADAGRYRMQFRLRKMQPDSVLRVEDNGIQVVDLAGLDSSGWVTVDPAVEGSLYNWSVGLHEVKVYFRSVPVGPDFGDLDWFRFSPHALTLPYVDTVPAVSVFGATKVEAEQYDRGGSGVAYADNTIGNSQSSFREEEDVDVALVAGTNYAVAGAADEWVKYSVNVTHAGVYELTYALDAPTGGTFRFKYKQEPGEVETADLSATSPQPVKVTLEAGPQTVTVRFTANGTGGNAGGLDWFRLTPAERSVATGVSATGTSPAGTNGYEVGTRFAVNVPGYVTALRFYKPDGEDSKTGKYTLNLWEAGNVKHSQVINIASGSKADWYEINVASPGVKINPGLFTVSVDIFSKFSIAANSAFASERPNVVSFVAGSYSETPGTYPLVPLNAYGFTDVEFKPDYGA